MQFKMIHENYNVADLAKSMAFYEEALGLKETRRKEAADGSFTRLCHKKHARSLVIHGLEHVFLKIIIYLPFIALFLS